MALLDCLIPVYNNQERLRSSLESLLEQSFQNFRIIAYDDASTDQSLSILEVLQKKESRLKIIKSNRHQGIAHSLNQLLKSASSPFICWQFPDSFSDPTRFEKQIYQLKNSTLVALGTSILFQGKTCESIHCFENPKDVLFQQLGSSSHRGLYLETVMYRKQAVKSIPPFNNNLKWLYDVEFHAELQHRFPLRIANLKEVLYTKRESSAPMESELQEERERVYQKIVFPLVLTKKIYYDPVIITPGFLPY